MCVFVCACVYREDHFKWKAHPILLLNIETKICKQKKMYENGRRKERTYNGVKRKTNGWDPFQSLPCGYLNQ